MCLLVCFQESRSPPFQPSPGSFSVFPSHHSGIDLIGPTFWPDSGFAVCVVGWLVGWSVGKVLHCSLGCPGICYVDQAILELTASRLPLPLSYWNQRCAPPPRRLHCRSLTQLFLVSYRNWHLFFFLDSHGNFWNENTKLKGEDKIESTAQECEDSGAVPTAGQGAKKKSEEQTWMKEEGKPRCLGGNSQRIPLLEHSALFMYKPVTMPLVPPQQR